MTKQELEAAQATIKRANELLANIATCEQLASQTLSLRKGGGEWIGDQISGNVISRGIKAWRDECEKELAALKLGPTPEVKPFPGFPPVIPNPLNPYPYPPLAPTCNDGVRTVLTSDTVSIGGVGK